MEKLSPANGPVPRIRRKGKFVPRTVTCFRPNARKVGYGSGGKVIGNKFIFKRGKDLGRYSPSERRLSRAFGNLVDRTNIVKQVEKAHDNDWWNTVLPDCSPLSVRSTHYYIRWVCNFTSLAEVAPPGLPHEGKALGVSTMRICYLTSPYRAGD